uniref:Dual specificity phosphatase 27 n=1 Tax=Sparus aurata TaxID=8175 RepID=A0A671XA26_SPAAU
MTTNPFIGLIQAKINGLFIFAGKVLVVSMMGVSRSAVLVASYLMIFQHMSIMEALTSMRKKRPINPNEGFLKQLRELNESLMEERDDDDDTLSQCSEEQSMIGVKAQSIMMEEEEDGQSVMSSIASSAAAAALKSGMIGEEILLKQDHREDGKDEDDDGLGSMIREWQRRNEQYQDDDWWEKQLNSDGEDVESLAEGRPKKTKEDTDVDSVTSEDVRAVKERLKRRNRRPPSDAMSTSSCTSYSDLWKQRLREIEEQAATRYRKKQDDEGSESTATEDGERQKKNIDDEVQSLLSDTTSMYNFCQKNKEKMTPLERWRIKRIQFGWNKKDREDGEKSSVGDGEGGDGEGEAKTPAFKDVNLTAYQSWKLRQQKRYGEENKDEILEMSRGEDSAAIKRRQRREEILERSKKTLEESQSMCGWDNESSVSGGTIPLSAFWAGAGVNGPPSVANDDNMSMLSGRSSVISSVSQPRSMRSAQSAVQVNPPVPPILPVPTVQGPGGEPMVNLSSIQNWIANVVSETIKQKQSEMSLPPPSRAGSEFSYGGAASVLSGRGVEDDKASLLSGASYSSALSQGRGRAASVLSGSALGSTLDSTLGSRRNKITTTSVPLFSLFQDQVDMGKLDAMDKEIKSEMRGKMATYEKKKILEDKQAQHPLQRRRNRRRTRMRRRRRRRERRSFLRRQRKGETSEVFLASPEEDESYGVSSRYRSRLQEDLMSEDAEYSCNGFHSRAGRSYGDEATESYSDFSTRRTLAHHSRYESSETEGRRSRREEADEEEDDIATFLAQTRQRIRARAAAEAEDDEVLMAWRAQQEAKSQSRSES